MVWCNFNKYYLVPPQDMALAPKSVNHSVGRVLSAWVTYFSVLPLCHEQVIQMIS